MTMMMIMMFRCNNPSPRFFEHLPSPKDSLQGRPVSHHTEDDDEDDVDVDDYADGRDDIDEDGDDDHIIIMMVSRWSQWRQVSGNVGSAWTPDWGSVGGVRLSSSSL